jgi:AraC family transcriptional regulator of adaptative response/methylated-DNA-[protein]-cysteine methyltransferase
MFELYYDAMFSKDDRFDGIFFTAVKTTGIFCRPICTARKPKRENVEFFANAADALSNGYRACKVCRPMEEIGHVPSFVKAVLAEIEDDFSIKLKDTDFQRKGIEPSKIRRWFQKNRGMTFHRYQRLFRLNVAFKKIQSGESVSAVAFDSGYGSLSGFNEAFKKRFGISPSIVRDT